MSKKRFSLFPTFIGLVLVAMKKKVSFLQSKQKIPMLV